MDKTATKARWFSTAEAVIAGGALALACEVSVAFSLKLLSLPFAPVLEFGSLFLGIVLLGHLIYRPLKEERRSLRLFRAALADDTNILPLAEPQPLPDETVLSLPCTFKLRRNWRGIAVIGGTIALGTWVLFGPLFASVLFAPPLVPPSVPEWLLYTSMSALCVSVLVPLLQMKSTPLQWLDVTAEGLISYEGGNPKILRWENIRLFVIPASGNRRDKPPRRYELFRKQGGPGLAFDVRRSARQGLFQMDKPALPFDEYDRQMDALLSVIAAKTGLPLYDLR